jgi:hypothetical protein
VTVATGSLTLAPFGDVASATFSAGADAATASELIVFGKPDHTCVLTCQSPTRLGLQCTNASTGATCTESFRK